jgi:disulfide bond formation protein DsbB
MQNKSEEPSYSIAGLDKLINGTINFIFYYRLIFVLACITIVIILMFQTVNQSAPPDKLKNAILVLTGGSIIIGIFFSLLNYEYNHNKSKRDIKTSKAILSFNTALEWHKPHIVENLKITKTMYETHKHLIESNKSAEFFDILEKDEKARAALVSIFNYLECIAVGINQGIMDATFIKTFFCSLFKSYYTDYEFYISYRRKKQNNSKAWENFTNLAQDWLKQN